MKNLGDGAIRNLITCRDNDGPINSLADLASETIIDGDIASLAKLEK